MTNDKLIEYIKTLDWYKDIIKDPDTEMIFLAGSRALNTNLQDSDYDIIVYSAKENKDIIETNRHIPNDLNLNMHYMCYSKDFLYGALTFSFQYPSNFWIISGLITPITRYQMIFKKDNSKYYDFLSKRSQQIIELGVAALIEHQWDELIYLSNHPESYNRFDRKVLYYLILGYQNLIQKKDISILQGIRLHKIALNDIEYIQQALFFLIDFYNHIDYTLYTILYTELEVIINGK